MRCGPPVASDRVGSILAYSKTFHRRNAPQLGFASNGVGIAGKGVLAGVPPLAEAPAETIDLPPRGAEDEAVAMENRGPGATLLAGAAGPLPERPQPDAMLSAAGKQTRLFGLKRLGGACR